MSFFNSVKSLGSAVIKTATVPVSVVADIATCGGLTTDRQESYTERHLKSAGRDYSESYSELVDD